MPHYIAWYLSRDLCTDQLEEPENNIYLHDPEITIQQSFCKRKLEKPSQVLQTYTEYINLQQISYQVTLV